jgi:hypothetical protein
MGPDTGRLARALEAAGGEYVLVVVGRNALIDVIPLAADSLKGMPLKGVALPGILPATAESGNGLLFDR